MLQKRSTAFAVIILCLALMVTAVSKPLGSACVTLSAIPVAPACYCQGGACPCLFEAAQQSWAADGDGRQLEREGCRQSVPAGSDCSSCRLCQSLQSLDFCAVWDDLVFRLPTFSSPGELESPFPFSNLAGSLFRPPRT